MMTEVEGVEVRSISELYTHFTAAEFVNQAPDGDSFMKLDSSSKFAQFGNHATANRFTVTAAAQTDGSMLIQRHATAVSNNDPAGLISTRYLKTLIPGREGEVMNKVVFQIKGESYLVGMMFGQMTFEDYAIGDGYIYCTGPMAALLFDSYDQKVKFVLSTDGHTDYGHHIIDIYNEKSNIEDDFTIFESQAVPNFDCSGAYNMIELDIAMSKGMAGIRALHWMAQVNGTGVFSKTDRHKSSYFAANFVRPFISFPNIASGTQTANLLGMWAN